MLKYKLNSADFEKLSEAEKTFYAQAGDGYQLQVEGATDKSKVDEFRQSNIKLMEEAKAFKDVDLDKYNAAMEKERALRNKELIDKGEFDTLLAEHTNAMKSDHDAKIEALSSKYDKLSSSHNATISKYEIEGAANKAFGAHKINPDAYDSIMAQIKTKFTIDNGQAVAKDGDKIIAGANGNLTIDEFVSSQPEIFKLQSSGGSGQGNNRTTAGQGVQTSREKITAGLASLMKN